MAAEGFGEHAIIAGILGIAVALVRIVERLVDKVLEKKNGKNGVHRPVIVQLDPEVSRVVKETGECVADIHRISVRTDQDGTPLVYGPRHEIRDIQKKVDKVGDDLGDILRLQEIKK